mmetsp:Transcript_28244/g.65412  ORF Transcript_28244/g.65412 Transcript_28244/m.65412 type:complete len:95 (-) Transcript_28244:778-1062(-)
MNRKGPSSRVTTVPVRLVYERSVRTYIASKITALAASRSSGEPHLTRTPQGEKVEAKVKPTPRDIVDSNCELRHQELSTPQLMLLSMNSRNRDA